MGSSNAYWFVPDRVVFVHNVGDLIAEDFRQVDNQIIAFMQEAQSRGVKKVHVLVDSTEMRRLPPMRDLERGHILNYIQEPACGWTVVVGVGANPVLGVLSRMLTAVMRVNLEIADTLEQARTFIQGIEPVLADLPNVTRWKRSYLSNQSSVRLRSS